MKPITQLFLFFLINTILTGCASYYRQYDPVEYNYAVVASVIASKAMKSCSNDSRDMFKTYIKDLNDVTYHLQEYEKFTSNNSKTFSSAVHLRHLVLEFNAIEKFSESYCIHKLSEIQNASSVVAKAFGRNKTQDICIYDVGVIYTQFKNSYLSGRISQLEFTNLLSGLSHLEQLDNNWCNNSRRYNIEYLIKSNPP